MCDSIVSGPSTSLSGTMLFGKNSDRQRNEAQALELLPGAEHRRDAQLECTYISIPQARRTYEVLLCRPFWIWGAEMGSNEHGVVIGNEGLQARGPAPESRALVGMDLVRLALERAASAAEAIDVITSLLRIHGQGGDCGHLTPNYYNNGFIVADRQEAFILETVEREWLLEKVSGARALSNTYSIANPTRASSGIDAVARELGGRNAAEVEGYAAALSKPGREHIGQACARHARSTALLRSSPALDLASMMAILRDHRSSATEAPSWNPTTAREYTLCMHAGPEDRPGQTTASLVSEIGPRAASHWVTGTSAPCISIFKPVVFGAALPLREPTLTDHYDPRTLWWNHERLHRAVLARGFLDFLGSIREERDALEADLRAQIGAVLDGGTKDDRARVVLECWRRALELEGRWQSSLPGGQEGPQEKAPASPYHAAWSRFNRLAEIPGAV